MKKLLEVFLVFFKIGIIGFGGGYATIPLIEKEVVKKKGWLSEEDLYEGVAFANIMPGPFAPQIVALCGYRAKGILGSFSALIALLLPSCTAIVFLMFLYNEHKEDRWIIGITQAIKPVVVVMIAMVVLKMAKRTFPSNIKKILSFDGIAIIVLASLTVLTIVLDIHPVIMIALAMLLGGILLSKKEVDENG